MLTYDVCVVSRGAQFDPEGASPWIVASDRPASSTDPPLEPPAPLEPDDPLEPLLPLDPEDPDDPGAPEEPPNGPPFDEDWDAQL